LARSKKASNPFLSYTVDIFDWAVGSRVVGGNVTLFVASSTSTPLGTEPCRLVVHFVTFAAEIKDIPQDRMISNVTDFILALYRHKMKSVCRPGFRL